MPSITSLSSMARDATTWPRHKKKKVARNRERRTIAREAQRKIDEARGKRL